MLILTRKLGESIQIDDDITITLLAIKGRQIRIGIEAPQGVAVHRQEVYQMIQEQNRRAAESPQEVGTLGRIWGRLRKEEGS